MIFSLVSFHVIKLRSDSRECRRLILRLVQRDKLDCQEFFWNEKKTAWKTNSKRDEIFFPWMNEVKSMTGLFWELYGNFNSILLGKWVWNIPFEAVLIRFYERLLEDSKENIPFVSIFLATLHNYDYSVSWMPWKVSVKFKRSRKYLKTSKVPGEDENRSKSSIKFSFLLNLSALWKDIANYYNPQELQNLSKMTVFAVTTLKNSWRSYQVLVEKSHGRRIKRIKTIVLQVACNMCHLRRSPLGWKSWIELFRIL